MKNEIDFLKQLKQEFDTIEYGEGVSVNSAEISYMIKQRIDQLTELKQKENKILKLFIKYKDIQDKVPSVWKTYEEAAIELADEIKDIWDIDNAEVIRVISFLDRFNRDANMISHIDRRFEYAGLYPEVMKSFKINPDTKP